MIVNQGMGLVLPASTKYLIDVVIGKGRTDLLWKIALAAGGATMVQAVTSFSLSQVRRGRPTRDYGNAQESPGADLSIADQLFRFHPNRQTHFPHHE